MTDLWEWMERPKWYRRSVPPKSEEDMTPEARTEWVKSLKRSPDESVRSPREGE